MASKKSGLTAAQERYIHELYLGTIPHHYNGSAAMALERKGLIEWVPRGSGEVRALTENGKKLADELFGSPDPTPDPDGSTDSTDTAPAAPVAGSQGHKVNTMGSNLTSTQKRELQRTTDSGSLELNRYNHKLHINVHERLVDMGLEAAEHHNFHIVYTLTEAGQQLARELFGSSTPETIASEPAPLADTELPFASFDDSERAETVKAELELPYATSDLVDFANAFNGDSNEPAAMPTVAPVDTISSDLTGVQVSSTVKAAKTAKNANTPQITKKERRKQKQNAIRQQYQVAQMELRRQRELARIHVIDFPQAESEAAA